MKLLLRKEVYEKILIKQQLWGPLSNQNSGNKPGGLSGGAAYPI